MQFYGTQFELLAAGLVGDFFHMTHKVVEVHNAVVEAEAVEHSAAGSCMMAPSELL